MHSAKPITRSADSATHLLFSWIRIAEVGVRFQNHFVSPSQTTSQPSSRLCPDTLNGSQAVWGESLGTMDDEPELLITISQDNLAEGRCSQCGTFFSVSRNQLSREALENTFTTNLKKCQITPSS